MKKTFSKKEAEEKIEEFFKRDNLKVKDTKKIKRLAMSYNLKLEEYKKRFCKKCFADLRGGKVRIGKRFKIVVCGSCGFGNRWGI